MNKTLSTMRLGADGEHGIDRYARLRQEIRTIGRRFPVYSRRWQREGGGSIVPCPVSAAFRTPVASPVGGGLRGLDKNPSEERVGGGTMLAKVDPSGSAGRQMDEIRAEQAASAAAGLRDVFFGYDSWTISEDGRQALTRDAEWMKSNSSALVKVEGHCDERGTSAYNLVLGEKRAKAARNYLVELGVERQSFVRGVVWERAALRAMNMRSRAISRIGEDILR